MAACAAAQTVVADRQAADVRWETVATILVGPLIRRTNIQHRLDPDRIRYSPASPTAQAP